MASGSTTQESSTFRPRRTKTEFFLKQIKCSGPLELYYKRREAKLRVKNFIFCVKFFGFLTKITKFFTEKMRVKKFLEYLLLTYDSFSSSKYVSGAEELRESLLERSPMTMGQILSPTMVNSAISPTIKFL